MSIRRRVALAFLAILALFALNIVVYFDGIGKRNASFEDLNQSVLRQLLIIDIQRQISSLTDVVRNLDLLAETDLESARLEPHQAEEKTQELSSLVQMAQRISRLSQPQPGAPPRRNDRRPIDLDAALRLSEQFDQLKEAWGDFFRCLSSPAQGIPADVDVDAADVGAGGGANPSTSAPTSETSIGSGLGTPEEPAEVASIGTGCRDPQLPLARDLAALLGSMESAERLRFEEARFHFAEVAHVTNRRILIIFAVSTLVAIVVALLFSAFLSRGLTALKLGARRIGQGDLEHRIPDHGQDELAELAHAFNDMSGNLLTARSKVEEARALAEEANRAKSSFLANMSHELRTPMNAIIGYSEMLIEEAEDLDQKESIPDLQRILKASNHLLELINDVLDLSKIEAGKMTLFLEDFTVESLIDDVTSTIQPLVDKNRNRLQLRLAPQLGSLRADETKVRQTLFNLLSNACKFTSEGTITLGAERYPTSGGDHLRFEVRDTGIGMSPKQMAHIFEEFTQADASTTRQFGGTGLGLTISKRFCQLMGGDLTVHSAPGSGTTFTIDLPAIVQPPDVSSSSASASPANAGGASDSSEEGETVLVIDDDPAALDLTRRFLEKEDGLRVVTCNNGEDGLRLAQELRPKAIILDIMMPQMDGWQVLSALQADDATRQIPVLLVSMLDEKEMGYALGASDYLNKPLNRQRLTNHLTRLASRPRGPGQVLIVDDDPTTRSLLRHGCEKDGWQVSEAENGLVALGVLANERPDLILLDLVMPQMDGFEFLAELRQTEETADLPVVVITGRDLDIDERQRLTGQAEAVLKKGTMSPKELLAELRRRMARPVAVA